MKKIKYSFGAALALILAGCTQDEEFMTETKPENPVQQIEITFGVPEQKDSRVSYDDRTSTPFAWESGDALVAVAFDEQGNFKGKSNFTMVGEPAENSATFTGKTVTGAETYKFYYKAKQLRFLSDCISPIVDYSTQQELAGTPTAHLKDYYILGTDRALNFKVLQAEKHNLKLQNSMLRIDVKSMPQEIGTLKSIILNTNEGTPESSTAILNVTQADGPFVAYMLFDPTDMAQKAGNGLSLIFKGDRSFRVKAANTKETLNLGGRQYGQTVAGTPAELGGEKGLAEWEEFVPAQVDAANHKITVAVPGMITTGLIQNAIGETGILKVEGPLNGTDMKVIRDAAGCIFGDNPNADPFSKSSILTDLDLGKASFVEGGMPYAFKLGEMDKNMPNREWYQKANTLSSQMFLCTKLSTLILPENITGIGSECFLYASGIRELTIPEQAVHWEREAFLGALTLEKVTIKAPITTLVEQAFSDCIALQSITIPATVERLENYCLANTAITSLFIPRKVKYIGHDFIGGCENLTSLTIEGKREETTLEPSAFEEFIESYDHAPLSQSCDLVLDASWAPDVTLASSGRLQFYNAEFKSIKTPEGTSFADLIKK